MMGSEYFALELQNIENNTNSWNKVEEAWPTLIKDFDLLYKQALEVKKTFKEKEIEKKKASISGTENEIENDNEANLIYELNTKIKSDQLLNYLKIDNPNTSGSINVKTPGQRNDYSNANTLDSDKLYKGKY